MKLTPAKLAANQANAKKSTGPRTSEGKQRSSRNAVKHGLLTSAIVLEGGESEDRFAATINSFLDEFRPETPNEEVFVEKMVVAHWRLRRLWAYEKASLKREIARQTGADLEADPPTRAMLAMQSLSEHSHHHELMVRYENLFDRAHYRALEGLRKLRAERENRDSAKRTQSSEASKTTYAADAPPKPKAEPKETPGKPIEQAVEPMQSPGEPKDLSA